MFQSIVNTLYRHPKGQWELWNKFGGYFEYRKMLASETEMLKASETLVVETPENRLAAIEVSFLTGKKYWHQTIFCAYSLQKVTPNPVHFTVYDDGSFDEVLIEKIRSQIINSTIVSHKEILERIAVSLPASKYPYLHHKREVYKHIRKLTDVHAGSKGWKLMLDSDMLFWKEPTQMIEWLKNPVGPFYILDIDNAYGYPVSELEKLTHVRIPQKMNVGAIGLQSETIDFDKLEHWAKTLETNFGNSYYLEQALSAMLVGNKPCTVGNQNDYIVFPAPDQIASKEGVLQHYVAESKKGYFTEAWRSLI